MRASAKAWKSRSTATGNVRLLFASYPPSRRWPRCRSPRIRAYPGRLCVRHFPLAAKRPRAEALHAAAEAAGLQRPDAFWQMVDATYADLKAKGVRFKSAPVDITHGRNAGAKGVYFFDPDDITLELIQPARRA